MLYRDILKILAFFLYALAAILLIPLAIAIYYEYFVSPLEHAQAHSTNAFLLTLLTTLLVGGICQYIGRNAQGKLYHREGILIVVLIWLITPALSALPFIYSGTLSRVSQAYFEMVSGYTTTGASILTAKKYDEKTGEEIPYVVHFKGVIPITYTFYGTVTPIKDPATGKVIHEGIEAIGKALLFWRNMTNYLGGIGIVVLFILIFPLLGVGGKMLYRVEAPGPIKDSLTPRIKETAWELLKIYTVLTIAGIVLLMVTNDKMSLYDAVTVSFSTIATGGFTIKNLSIAEFNNVNTDTVITIFMLIGSTNFALYYYAMKGKFYRFYDTEFILFIIINTMAGWLLAYYIVDTPQRLMTGETAGTYSWPEAIRHGFFQAISVSSSTGFTTANFDLWPYKAQVVIIMLMYCGGMAGSTCGGIKIIRLYMLFRIAQYKIESIFRPQTVRLFKVGTHEVDYNTASTVLTYFLIIIALSVLSAYLYVIDGIDLETSLGCVAASINNVGVAFRMAGPTQSLAFMSDFSLYLSCALMLLGRLEFFVLLAILVPAFWKQNS